jgi:hypothetical protein
MNRSKKKALRTVSVAILETIRGGGQLGTVKWEDDKLNDIRL